MTAYDAFAPVYDRWAAGMTEDVPFYVSLARETAPGPVIELAVGTGRVAIPLAHETGRRVIGIDSSRAMLEQARTRARDAGVDLELRLADMRELDVDEPVALFYCPARSLLHLPTWDDRRRVFERIAASLSPDGRFAWNAFVFDHRVAAELDGTEREQNGIVHRLRYIPADNRIDIEHEETTISLWWLTRSEWEGLIDVAGLEVEALFGWFDRRPFTDESREFVWIARKPS